MVLVGTRNYGCAAVRKQEHLHGSDDHAAGGARASGLNGLNEHLLTPALLEELVDEIPGRGERVLARDSR